MKTADLFSPPGFLTDENAIRAWIMANCKRGSGKPITDSFIKVEGGKASVNCEVVINNDVRHLRVEFDTVHTFFNASGCKLVSAAGSPRAVESLAFEPWISYANCKHLKSLDGVTRDCYEISLAGCPITSFHNIHTVISSCHTLFVPDLTSHALGTLLIKGIKAIKLLAPGSIKYPPKLETVVRILDTHAGTGKAGVIAAQQELLDADLDEFAQL